MKHSYLLSLALLPLWIPVGCASNPKITDLDTTTAPALATLPVETSSSDSVRTPENLKAYPVGRYTDSDSPEVMHEAHTVYRAENSPQWNLAPNAPTAVPLGPTPPTGTVAVADPARQHVALTAELEQRLKQEEQLLQTTYEQNERLSQEVKKLQEQLPKLRAPEEPQQPVVSTASPPLQPMTDLPPQPPVTATDSTPQQRTWKEWFRSYWSKSTPAPAKDSSQ